MRSTSRRSPSCATGWSSSGTTPTCMWSCLPVPVTGPLRQGADIKYMSGLDPDGAKEWGALGHEVGRLLETGRQPSIAAVNGLALGGGCELALACDIRYAASTAKLGQPEVNLGILPGWGGTQRLARVCGIGVAKDLILTGRMVDAEEALRIHLVSAVFEPAELLAKAMETAQRLAAKGPLALAAAKTAINHALQGDPTSRIFSRRAIASAACLRPTTPKRA